MLNIAVSCSVIEVEILDVFRRGSLPGPFLFFLQAYRAACEL